MIVDIIDSVESLHQVKNNWESVYRADPEAHYYLSWAMIALSFEPLAGIWLVLAAKPGGEADDYVAFLPVRLNSHLDGDGNFRHSVRLGGSIYAIYTNFLCLPDYEAPALKAFGQQIQKLNWAELHLDYVAASEARQRHFLDSFPEPDFATKKMPPMSGTGFAEDIDYDLNVYVDLPGDWDEFLATNLGPKTRRDARNFLRKIEPGSEYRVSLANAESIDRDFDAFMNLWRIQWESSRGAQYADYVAHVTQRMVQNCSSEGTIIIPVLWKDDRPIGVHIALADREKRTIICSLVCRDLSIRKPPPGFLLHIYTMRWAIANGFTRYDLGVGDYSYKYNFGSREQAVERLAVSTRTGANLRAPLDKRFCASALQETVEQYYAGNIFHAGQGCRSILAFDPEYQPARKLLESIESDPIALLAEARRLFKSNNVTAAQLVCEEVLRRHPANSDAHQILGSALLQLGLAPEAEDHIRHAIRQKPNSASAHNNLGLALSGCDRLPEALASYDQALALRPNYARAFLNRGIVLRRMGRLEEAVDSFESALALRPDYHKAIDNRDETLRQLSD